MTVVIGDAFSGRFHTTHVRLASFIGLTEHCRQRGVFAQNMNDVVFLRVDETSDSLATARLPQNVLVK